MTRAEKVAAIQEMRAKGVKYRQIAEQLGIPASTARTYGADPDGAKQAALRRSYRGTCEVCGAATDGSKGRAKAPKRCHLHAELVNKGQYGTGERQRQILLALRHGITRPIQIAQVLGITQNNAKVRLYELMDHGAIERVSRGQYRVRDAA